MSVLRGFDPHINPHRKRAGSVRLAASVRPGALVPAGKGTGPLVVLAAATTAVLAVFALALALAFGRLAAGWETALAGTATVKLSAPAADLPEKTARAVALLGATPGVVSARALEAHEARRLLEPWLGSDVSLELLPLPQLIEVFADPERFDPAALRERLAAEVPEAELIEHGRWRAALASGARALRLMGMAALTLSATTLVVLIALAASVALAVNGATIRVLRLVGARDAFILRAFTRRFALRAFLGAAVGAGLASLALLSARAHFSELAQGLGPARSDWALIAAVPVWAALVAWITTWIAARRVLQKEG